MNAYRRFGLGLALVGLLLGSAAPTLAADNGTVDAQVTVATPCVTVGPAIDYGVKRFGAPAAGSSSFTNCSTDTERIYLRGTDAVSTSSAATWQLTTASTSPAPGNPCPGGVNRYFHFAGVQSYGVPLTLNDQQVTDAPAGDSTPLYTALELACPGSDGGGETMTFSIIVTASF
jgi:hypothetical protein